MEFVMEAEGFRPVAYSDYKQTSVGYGTRGNPGEVLSESQARARLENELSGHASRVDQFAAQKGFSLTPEQRAALISFDFNTGDAEKLILESNSIDEIRRRLPSWNKVTEGGNKVFNQGLANRREKELRLFNS